MYLAQLGAEGAHFGGALRGVAGPLGVGQDIKAAREDVAVALQLRLRQLQRHSRLAATAHRQSGLRLAATQRPAAHPPSQQLHLSAASFLVIRQHVD